MKNPWIEAMRLRTLPVCVAGVAAGTGVACYLHSFSPIPMAICLLFAIIAQIASNFANEYYDYANGLDKKGREGFRRGVTEGDIEPRRMRAATYLLLSVDSLLGCSLIAWGGWWLIVPGILIALFAVGYSTGPWPLSHHGLGDIAVIVFFGFVPVYFTAYVQTGIWDMGSTVWLTGLAIGLMGANVLIVNNYRDADDDRAVGKHTTVVIFGREAMSRVYLINGLVAITALTLTGSPLQPFWTVVGRLAFVACHLLLWNQLKSRRGHELNDILKWTSILLLLTSNYQLCMFAVWPKP